MHPALPFYILSALGAAVAIASLGLPGTDKIDSFDRPKLKLRAISLNNFPSETADEKLPNSLEEGERFGLGQSFLMVPFLQKHEERLSGKKKNQEDGLGEHFKGSTLTMETNISD